MAQVTQAYVPAYRPDELRLGKFQSSFANTPHDVYAIYDEVMDQLIIRLVDPSVPASEYYISENIAFLVRDDDREVIGLTIVDFASAFLPQAPKLNELWKKKKMAEKLSQYRQGKYDPEPKQQKTQLTEERIFKYSAYRSKAVAEAELVMA